VKLRVIWIGKTRDANLSKLAQDFESRVRHFLPIEITELKDSRNEAEKILASLEPSDRVIALDETGRPWTSAQFATFVGKHMREDPRRLTFLIGGHTGLADSVKKRAELTWALSPLTYTHDMARVMLLEQIYRALATIHNHPYPR
jgi:23S rRNA (pseudouridine1915-N3)-methyltransferase